MADAQKIARQLDKAALLSLDRVMDLRRLANSIRHHHGGFGEKLSPKLKEQVLKVIQWKN